jgi:glycine cleavage system aminomethyltransferase T
MNKNVGLGYIQKEYSPPGTRISIKVRNDFIGAQIVKIPFVGKD